MVTLVHDELKPITNTRISETPFKFGKKWKIEVEIKIDGSDTGGWRSIFRVTNTKGNHEDCGDRYPAMFVRQTNKILIRVRKK